MSTSSRYTSPKRSLPRVEPDLETILESLPASRQRKIQTLQEQISRASESRGSTTRGWAGAEPQKGSERRQLSDKCGGQCFIDPKNEAFPVCPALRTTGGKCGVDCRGILASKQRGSQTGRDWVVKEADRLGKQYDCDWASGRAPTKSPRATGAKSPRATATKSHRATKSPRATATKSPRGSRYDKMTVVQLKDELRRRNMKVSGTKSELIQRLM